MVRNMQMLTEKTDYYFRFIEEIEDRLDYVFNHPSLDIVNTLQNITIYQVRGLGGDINGIKIIDNLTSGSTPKNLQYDEEGVMFIRANNVLEDYLDLDNVIKIERSFHEGILKSSQLKKDDVVVTMAGTIGRCAMYTLDEEANINQAIASIRVNKDAILPEYLSLYLNSQFGQLNFLKYRHDVGQPNINLDEIKKIKIIIPPLYIQEKIVEKILTKKQEVIKAINTIALQKEKVLNTILENLDIGILDGAQQYFFKTGAEGKTMSFYKFPDELDERLHYLFYHPKYEILEELGRRYKLVKLKDIVSELITRGEQPEYAEEGITVIKTVDLKNGRIDYENCLNVSEEFFEKYAKNHPEGVLRKGDILIASTGYVSMGKVDVYERDKPAMADGHISILRVNTEYDPYFVTYYLRCHLGQIQFDKWWSGSSGQIEIQSEDLGEFLIPESSDDGIPLDKQKEIAKEIAEKLKELLEMEKQANEKWEEAKKLFEKLVLEGVENGAAE